MEEEFFGLLEPTEENYGALIGQVSSVSWSYTCGFMDPQSILNRPKLGLQFLYPEVAFQLKA